MNALISVIKHSQSQCFELQVRRIYMKKGKAVKRLTDRHTNIKNLQDLLSLASDYVLNYTRQGVNVYML